MHENARLVQQAADEAMRSVRMELRQVREASEIDSRDTIDRARCLSVQAKGLEKMATEREAAEEANRPVTMANDETTHVLAQAHDEIADARVVAEAVISAAKRQASDAETRATEAVERAYRIEMDARMSVNAAHAEVVEAQTACAEEGQRSASHLARVRAEAEAEVERSRRILAANASNETYAITKAKSEAQRDVESVMAGIRGVRQMYEAEVAEITEMLHAAEMRTEVLLASAAAAEEVDRVASKVAQAKEDVSAAMREAEDAPETATQRMELPEAVVGAAASAALEAAQGEIRASQQAASSFVERAQQLVERMRQEAALAVAATQGEREEALRAAYAAAPISCGVK